MVAYLRNLLKSKRGQSLAETAVVLPIVLLLFCGIVDFGWIMGNRLVVENGCREGARLGAVVATESDYRAQVASRVMAVTPAYARERTAVTANASGDDITVTVSYTFPILTPLGQTLLGKQEYSATSTCVMRVE